MTLRFRGMSLIDIIIGSALLLTVFLSIFASLRGSLSLSNLARANVIATELANSQIEFMRGFSYDALGTVGGIPAGSIAQSTTTTISGIPFTTRTLIEYKDDPADGLGALDSNHVTTDYKVVKVTVSYQLYGTTHAVTYLSTYTSPVIESSTGGGTLSIHVVNATGADLANAAVQIVNASTSPTVNLTTNTDNSGMTIIGGAATSTQYQILVSRPGYSSAQTYARTALNVNPTPGYLTVVKDMTTSVTFAIDLLANLTLSSLAVPAVNVFSDTFLNNNNLGSQINTVVTNNSIVLAADQFSGSALSIPISPTGLLGWGVLSAAIAAPAQTSVIVHVADRSGNLLPDTVLAGNAAGFSAFPVSLTGVAASSYPSLTLRTDLSRVATSSNPQLNSWSLSHTDGLTPVPAISFTLTGAKTIGTNGSGQSIYKTNVTGSTDAGGSVKEMLEWDAYSLTLSSSTSLESCPIPPYALSPGTNVSAQWQIGSLSANTLPILVQDSLGSPIMNALVVLSNASFAETIPTDACGVAFFNGLSNATYSATASAPGHATTTINSLSVSGHAATTAITLP
ncbi:carboxypeptidase regulatory-like domain-containing protein [Patescibacteria group bacterium]|nr:carboxypeptidase regulatory-like domain-containing protein [Patescibacteria group bacterium]